jgi:hypothetical protein
MTLPAPPACLNRPYCARPNQSGGTLIAEDVREPNEHRRRLLDPDEYRPCSCLNCRGSRLHAHSWRNLYRGAGSPLSLCGLSGRLAGAPGFPRTPSAPYLEQHPDRPARARPGARGAGRGPRNRPCHDAAPVGGPVGFERPSPDRSLGRPLPRAVRRDRASPDRLEPRRPRAGAAEPGTSRGRLCAEPNRGSPSQPPHANTTFFGFSTRVSFFMRPWSDRRMNGPGRLSSVGDRHNGPVPTRR